jgi:trigger factor
MAKLIEENEFEVPATLIESQARNLLNNFAQDLQQRGVDLNRVQNDFVAMAFEQMKSQAERDVRGALLLDKIGEAEKVEVSDAEIEEEIGKLAAHYRVTPDDIRDSLRKQGGEGSISNNLKTRKSIEALVAKAKIVDGEWKDPSAETQTEAISAKPKKAAKAKSTESKAKSGESKPKSDESKKKSAKSKA